MSPPDYKALIERWFGDLFTRGDIAVLDELAAPDFVSCDPSGKVGAQGVDAFKKWLDWYFTSFTDREWAILDTIAEGEKVAVRYSGKTTYRGGLLDIPSSNQRVTEMGILIFRIQSGKVAEMWSALSDLELVLELGAMPTVP